MIVKTQQWINSCIKEHGRVLRGNCSHWCPDWNFTPIDETCIEFESCTCDFNEEKEDLSQE